MILTDLNVEYWYTHYQSLPWQTRDIIEEAISEACYVVKLHGDTLANPEDTNYIKRIGFCGFTAERKATITAAITAAIYKGAK